MRFCQYFKKRRIALGLDQKDFPGFDASYISKIERGKNNPTKYEKIASLAKTLRLSPNMTYWLLAYSFFDQDPYECIPSMPETEIYAVQSAEIQTFKLNEYYAQYGSNTKEIRPGDYPDKVKVLLGEPDENLRYGKKERWIYESKAIHIVFEEGHVVDVSFK